MPMFRSLDALLLASPPWYRTPLVQTTALGLVFFCVFTAYTTLQFYSASIYGPVLAANAVCAVYTSFTVSCAFAPAVANKLGCRRTMLVGIMGYAVLVLCSMVYFWHHNDDDDGGGGGDGDWAGLVVGGGAVLGIGAALLWTAQGRLILQYAAVADELAAAAADDRSKSSSNDSKHNSKSKSGAIISRFWSVFQCSALVGGTISFAYYNSRPTGSTALYVVFLAFILAGAVATQLLLPPSMLLRNTSTCAMQSKKSYDCEGNVTRSSTSSGDCTALLRRQALPEEDAPLLSNRTEILISPMQIEQEVVSDGESDDHNNNNNNNNNKKEAQDATSNLSWSEEARKTLALFFTSVPMLLLSVLFFYTGFNQPYQQATFGNRFFNGRTIGLELIVFHLMEVIGAIYCGRALDNGGGGGGDDERRATEEKRRCRPDGITDRRRIEDEQMDAGGGGAGHEKVSSEKASLRTRNSHRQSSIRCLVVFLLVNTAGNVLAFVHELNSVTDHAVPMDITDPQSLWPTLAFAFWGFADSQIQVYCYWLLGSLYDSAEEHSRAVGFFKCVQSLGVSIGYYLTPTSRLSAVAQLTLSSGIFVVGTALAFWQQCTTLGGSSSAP